MTKKITSILFFLFVALFAEAQEILQKKPKIIFYDAEGKPASLDKVNDDLKTYVATLFCMNKNMGETLRFIGL